MRPLALPPSRSPLLLLFLLFLSFAAASEADADASALAERSRQALFVQHCFWTGEMEFGAIEGVLKTEAGFYGGREVTRVWYDPDIVTLEQLKAFGARAGVADKVYLPSEAVPIAGASTEARFEEERYRRAPERDQKKQLQGTALEGRSMSDYQATKVNAFVRRDYKKALRFLGE